MTNDWNLGRVGGYGAFAALAVTVLAFPLLTGSESACRFVGSPTQDYSGAVQEPGNTAGLIAFTIGPLLAVGALALLRQARREGRPGRRLTVAAAVLSFPIAFLDFLIWLATGAFGCGIGLS